MSWAQPEDRVINDKWPPETAGFARGSKIIGQPSFEQTLLNHIAAPNSLALSMLYDLTGYQPYSIARCFLPSEEEAKAVVAHVYSYIWNHADDHDCRRQAIMPWLIAITESQVRRHQRHPVDMRIEREPHR